MKREIEKLDARENDNFCEELLDVESDNSFKQEKKLRKIESHYELLYDSLVFALRDFLALNGFEQVVVGISGGIDSALCATIAVDAVGAKNVLAVFMPSSYTSKLSEKSVMKLCDNLYLPYKVIPIDDVKALYEYKFLKSWEEQPSKKVSENLQTRIRGVILMAFANQYNAILLATGNKSEIMCGYCTLYGDTCGGFAPIGNLFKTEIYAIASYKKFIKTVIPREIIDRAPTAELCENQLDSDDLPPYKILDQILNLFVIEKLSREEIIKRGFEVEVVDKIIQLVEKNSYKGKQFPPFPGYPLSRIIE